eukprot:55741-Eustigmatos_ZCMA.PRE.1
MFHPAPESALFNEFGIQPNNYVPSPKSKPRRSKNSDDGAFAEFGDIFSKDNKATPILGRGRRDLLT